MRPRRELAMVVVAAAVAAGLALWGVSRTWSVTTVARPAPLPAEEVVSTGWAGLSACGFVVLAAAGALWATRGWGRRLVGGVVVACGVGLVLGGGWGLVSATKVIGPLSTCVAGAVALGCGGLAVARGGQWPTMGTRYERSAPKKEDMWDALDRGEDPTHYEQ